MQRLFYSEHNNAEEAKAYIAWIIEQGYTVEHLNVVCSPRSFGYTEEWHVFIVGRKDGPIAEYKGGYTTQATRNA